MYRTSNTCTYHIMDVCMRYSINWLPHATFRPIDTVEYMIHNLGTDVSAMSVIMVELFIFN